MLVVIDTAGGAPATVPELTPNGIAASRNDGPVATAVGGVRTRGGGATRAVAPPRCTRVEQDRNQGARTGDQILIAVTVQISGVEDHPAGGLRRVGDDAVVAIADGKESDVLPADEVAIVRFARNIARDARRITSGQVEALTVVHGLSDEDIFDIAAIAAGRSFFTKILDALGSEPDSSFMAMGDDLRRRLTVGRPISCGKPEYVGETMAEAVGATG